MVSKIEVKNCLVMNVLQKLETIRALMLFEKPLKLLDLTKDAELWK